MQKWDLDGYRVARVTFFSDDDSADQTTSSTTPASATSTVDLPAAPEESATGPKLVNRGDDRTALARAPASACTSTSEKSGSHTPATGGAPAPAVTTTNTAQTVVSGTSCSSCSVSESSSLESSQVSQHTTDDVRSGSPVVPKASGADAETTVLYSAELRQMARHVQITVKEWLVSYRSAVRVLPSNSI